MPRFMAILIDSIEAAEEEIPPEQWQAMMDDYDEFGAKAGEAGVIGGGEALQPPSSAVGATSTARVGTPARPPMNTSGSRLGSR